MTGLLAVQTIAVPRSRVAEAYSHLRRRGLDGHEGFVLWAGVQQNDRFLVQSTLIPRQSGVRSDEGVCVAVDGSELHRLNVWLYEHAQRLVAQLHTHPTIAYHSTTDNAYPIVTEAGGISIVVPNFALDPWSFAECAVYRLSDRGEWQELSPPDVRRLISITE